MTMRMLSTLQVAGWRTEIKTCSTVESALKMMELSGGEKLQ